MRFSVSSDKLPSFRLSKCKIVLACPCFCPSSLPSRYLQAFAFRATHHDQESNRLKQKVHNWINKSKGYVLLCIFSGNSSRHLPVLTTSLCNKPSMTTKFKNPPSTTNTKILSTFQAGNGGRTDRGAFIRDMRNPGFVCNSGLLWATRACTHAHASRLMNHFLAHLPSDPVPKQTSRC